jgi:Protein of unknown function (DUF3039)
MGINLDALLDTEEVVDSGHPIFAHIVDRGDNPQTAEAIILEARVNGTPITALCGHTWVPSRDPKRHPVCPKCLEIFEFAADFRGV